MKLKYIFIFISLFTLCLWSVTASFTNVKFFNLVEFNFYTDDKTDSHSSIIDEKEPSIEEKEEIIVYEDIIIDPISKVDLVNNKLYIYISDFDFIVWNNTLYINWFKVADKLKKERYYSNENYLVYSIDKKYISTSIFEWDNDVYFKNNKTYDNTLKYSFYYWDLIEYEWITKRLKCNWNIDKVVLFDEYGKIIYDKNYNIWSYYNITLKTKNQELSKWYYMAKIYCSNKIKDLYFVSNFNFNYNTRYNLATNISMYWDYFTKDQYFKIKK